MLANLYKADRRTKQAVMVVFDLISFFLTLWASFILRTEAVFIPSLMEILYYFCAALAFSAFLLSCKVYEQIFRYVSWAHIVKLCIFTGMFSFCFFCFLFIFEFAGVPRSAPLIQFPILFSILTCARLSLGLLEKKKAPFRASRKIGIFGAGQLGAKVYETLNINENTTVEFFVDEDPNKIGKLLFDKPVISPEDFNSNYSDVQLDLFIAINSMSRGQRRHLLDRLMASNRRVRFVNYPFQPFDLLSGLFNESHIDYLDLLPNSHQDFRIQISNIKDRNVLITGAGGSIGSELAKQIIENKPRSIILVDFSEYNLFMLLRTLNQRMDSQQDLQVELRAFLGSTTDEHFMRHVFSSTHPDFIYHAAAYKHVKLVEENPSLAFENNVKSTRVLCDFANEFEVELFVLVSSDKSVKSENIMGASKRFSELLVLSNASKSSKTKFACVRFGNVLGSSGSAIKIFEQQIRTGGPITLTHPETTRYFMTINDAVSLVLLAGEKCNGGEVFVLNMGEPIKILDLCRRMIALFGRSERSKDNPDGDIEIKITGLVEGEKLHEILSFDNEMDLSSDGKFWVGINSGQIAFDTVQDIYDELLEATSQFNDEKLRAILEREEILYRS